MDKINALQLEEYKYAKERINTLETKRHQTILLNLSALAAIIGFAEILPASIIPYLSLSILLFGSYSYAIYDSLQKMTTTFIVERYENSFSELNFESGYLKIMSTISLRKPIPSIVWWLGDPYFWLTAASSLISIVYGSELLASKVPSYSTNSLKVYLAGLIVGHLFVLPSFYIRYKRNFEFFRIRWRHVIELVRE